MKYLAVLTLFMTLLVSNKDLKAQGNLQFNRVMYIELAGSTPHVFNVPVGKVWKVESAGTGSTSTGYVYLQNASGDNLHQLAGTGGERIQLPVWLPGGFSGQFVRQFNTSSFDGGVSVIEFNVVTN